MAELTRKEFYQLAIECRERALELARHDQHRVVPAQCKVFNQWLEELQRYERLQTSVGQLQRALPITRWHLMGVVVLAWLLFVLFAGQQLSVTGQRALGFLLASALLLLFFLPERFYGTTVEMLEGKVLRVVEAMEKILLSQESQFTEAAYFQVKENLATARKEMRQQIHLAH